MRIPEKVNYQKNIADSSELEFCYFINDRIKQLTKNNKQPRDPNFMGEIYGYYTKNIQCTFKESLYGNDHYYFAISSNLWDEMADDAIRKDAVEYRNGFILIYHFQDSLDRKILYKHLPGPWYGYIKK